MNNIAQCVRVAFKLLIKQVLTCHLKIQLSRQFLYRAVTLELSRKNNLPDRFFICHDNSHSTIPTQYIKY